MPRGRRPMLTRESIVTAAVTVAARAQPEGLTGANVGEELGVDRSTLWRYFVNHQELLLAVGDRLLQTAVNRVAAGLSPQERVRTLALHLVDVFVAHPYIATNASCITRGPGEFAVIELILGSLEETGLRGEAVARHQRMLTDALLAYAGMRAAYAILPARVRIFEERSWPGVRVAISPRRFPRIASNLPALDTDDHEQVFTTLLDALWASVSAATTLEPSGQR
ncbi:TetR family transcriptional regulator [Lentzea flaviverrucosa]|uniref:Transcriptional regulator, TetR family n=1 Tax=Lentzea flaviverrucosa TaxID=200379 RepID=A0A1H9XTH0_9PSEU|nr:TetR family transcriptional regulator [Lentzea flaviverrucosa]SES49017.1 transcriptional regulator, TetR family [Lentzea flaviverrucosa]